jgi:hypothetical protein
MKVAQTITVGGLENKDIAWECDRDGVTAELRHPVQLVHVNVGDTDAVDGRRRRLVHKEIRGAELIVYHEWLPGGAAAATIERGNAATVMPPAREGLTTGAPPTASRRPKANQPDSAGRPRATRRGAPVKRKPAAKHAKPVKRAKSTGAAALARKPASSVRRRRSRRGGGR